VQVFTSQPAAGVREFVRAILNQVSATDDRAPTSLHISASAGIAAVDSAADSFESLAAAAAGTVADEAQQQGGDRWLWAGAQAPIA
jgi:GGDEF domain-containing protein